MAKKQTDGNLALEQQRVIVIPAHDEFVARKLRVAAYARVSSSSEDQLNSYRVQNQYYSELISSNPDWEMVDIYADEGITGTSVEKRESTAFWSSPFPALLGIRKTALQPSGNSKNLASASCSRNRVSTPARCPARWLRQLWRRWRRRVASRFQGMSSGDIKKGCEMVPSFPHSFPTVTKLSIKRYTLTNSKRKLYVRFSCHI